MISIKSPRSDSPGTRAGGTGEYEQVYVHPVVPVSFHPSGLSHVLLSPELKSQSEEERSDCVLLQTLFSINVEVEFFE
ncbi:MAG: hypothetical protein CVT89_01960 [Candidatus Altiarchaeales archaeon HGW-Altiarchaeales-2]|nr:MAG: hypothetical protein CVT89_01960 [Candidatus Altiarchaeales archaeon HGW-Altiarchaeales-2]